MLFTMLFHRGPCYWIIRKLLCVLGHTVHNVALHCLEGTFMFLQGIFSSYSSWGAAHCRTTNAGEESKTWLKCSTNNLVPRTQMH